jgi:Tol biopolymer transport system component
MNTRSSVARLASIFILALFVAGVADAQYFGRNKVQWEKFDFKVLHTPHFDIYYYKQEADVVNDIGRMAERWYDRLSRVFAHEFAKKPIVLYANSADFQQTTTTPGLIGEGTGGFTDPFQNRIVMPLTGDYAENDHVLGHEMVHVFQFDIANTLVRNRRRFDVEGLPLWIVEGMAEYFSKGRVDPLTAMWIRDATNHNRLPDLRRLTDDPRYFPYRYGEAFFAYVGGRYGDDNVVRFFLAAGSMGIEEAFLRVFGIPAKQIFEDWHASARELYEPVFLRRPETLGTPLLGRKTTRGTLNIGPAVSPDGRWIAFLSTRELFTIDLYLADAKSGRIVRKLLSADTNPHFDALRFIDSAGSWSPDSRKLAVATYERGDNYLAIVDADSGKVDRTIRVPGVDALSNPAWSPDGHSIAFSGQPMGVTDLFIYDLDSHQVRRLTNDVFADLEPAWSPDGKTIAFVSDRGAGTELSQLRYNEMRISTIDVASGAIKTLPLFEAAKHINPQFSPDGGSLYFIANPEGVPDIYRYSFADGTITRMTRIATGVGGITELSPALSVSQSGTIAFSVYENDDYDIYELPQSNGIETVSASLGNEAPRAALLPPLRATAPTNYTSYLERPLQGLLPESSSFPTTRYSPALHLTYLGPPTIGVGVDRFGYGAAGTISAYFSDVLGQQNVGFTFQGGGSSYGGSVGDQFGADAFYLNQKQRFNWGADVSHIPYVTAATAAFQDFVDVNGQQVLADIYQQQRDIVTVDDISGLAQYPLSQTRRLETSVGLERLGFKTQIEQLIYINGQLASDETHTLNKTSLNFARGSFAFVGDSSVFGFISPIRGTRYRYDVEALSGDLNFETALADYRHYFFARPVTFAIRGLHYGRYGSDAEDPRISPLFLGDGTLVRGYEFGSFDQVECHASGSDQCPVLDRLIGSRIAVANAEVRVPLFGVRGFGIISGAFLPTELVGFFDAGAAWTAENKVKVRFSRDTNDRVPVASAGIAARILLAYIPLEFYWAKPFQRPDSGWVFGFNIAPGW